MDRQERHFTKLELSELPEALEIMIRYDNVDIKINFLACDTIEKIYYVHFSDTYACHGSLWMFRNEHWQPAMLQGNGETTRVLAGLSNFAHEYLDAKP